MASTATSRWSLKKLAALPGVQVGAIVLLFSGCFSYRSAELATLPEGGHVRVHLSRQGFAALPEAIHLTSPRVAGTLVSRNEEQLRLRVPMATDGLTTTVAEEFVIPARDIVRFETRELSRIRTGIAVAGGIATAVALYLTFEKGNPFSPDESKDPEEEGPFTTRLLRVLRVSIPVR